MVIQFPQRYRITQTFLHGKFLIAMEKSLRYSISLWELSELLNLLIEEKAEDAEGTLQADSLTLWEKFRLLNL